MVRFLGAPALALTLMTAASSAALAAAHRPHHAVHVGLGYHHVRQLRRVAVVRHRGHRRYVGAFALADRAAAIGQEPRGAYAMVEQPIERRAPFRPQPTNRGEAFDRPRGAGGRPRAWCGWYARQLVGQDPGPAFNLARNWSHWGRAASPGVGVVVVWPHHVGMITGRTADGQWIVKSGNDGRMVRERPRSIAGAIAFRES